MSANGLLKQQVPQQMSSVKSTWKKTQKDTNVWYFIHHVASAEGKKMESRGAQVKLPPVYHTVEASHCLLLLLNFKQESSEYQLL